MRPGMWSSSLTGDTQDWVLRIGGELNQIAQALFGEIELREGALDRYWAFYVNGIKTGVQEYITETPHKFDIPVINVEDSICVSVEDCGDWAKIDYDPNYGPLEYEAITAEHITFAWKPKPTIIEFNSIYSEFSSWVINGLKRFSNIGKDNENNRIYGWLNVELLNQAGTYYLNLYNGESIVASGNRVGNGSITISQQSASGISGSVSIIFGSTITLGNMKLLVKWPDKYQLHYSIASLSFPRTPEAIIKDDGSSEYYRYSTPKLSPDEYNTAIVPVSEDGVEEVSPYTEVETILEKVKFPYALKYKDGDSTNTRISFYASNVTYTHRIYCSSAIGEPPDMVNYISDGAGAGEHLVSLLNYGSGVSGQVYVTVRSVSAGNESQQDVNLTLTYESGVYVLNRPVQPSIVKIVKSGLKMTVTTEYNHIKSNSYPAKIQLFVVPYSDAINYTLPKVQVMLGSQSLLKSINNIEYTVPTVGFYKVAVRAILFDLVTQDSNTYYRTIYMTNAAPLTVLNRDTHVSRGG